MADFALKPHATIPKGKPVLVVVLDGVGIGPKDEFDACHVAQTPLLDKLEARYWCTRVSKTDRVSPFDPDPCQESRVLQIDQSARQGRWPSF